MSFINELTAWISKMNLDKKLFNEITAINFGIFESVEGYMIYLTGAKQFDQDKADWACSIDFDLNSDQKYLLIPKELTANTNWKEVLYLTEITLKEFIDSDRFKDSYLFERILTTGFDDGDLIRIR